MRSRIGLVMASLLVAMTAAVAGPAGSASAFSCVIVDAPTADSGVHFFQQASFEICPGPNNSLTGGTAKVGVFMTPFSGYVASHIIGCSAHLELTDTTLGTSTRSDRPVNCTTLAHNAALGERVPIGPSTWTNQHYDHSFKIRAWINIQTGVTEYMTMANASVCEFPDGDTVVMNCHIV
jgi:hypothetical protein